MPNFTWAAMLRDGRCVSESDGIRFRDIATDITDLALVPNVEDWPTYRHALNPGQRAVWCRRHFQRLGLAGPVDGGHSILHIIGFQTTGPDGRNYQSLIYVPDDGGPATYGPGPFDKDHAVYGWAPVG
jgi:hypothetical protein